MSDSMQFAGQTNKLAQRASRSSTSNINTSPSSTRQQQEYSTLDIGPPSPSDPSYSSASATDSYNHPNHDQHSTDSFSEDPLNTVRTYESEESFLPTTSPGLEKNFKSAFFTSKANFQPSLTSNSARDRGTGDNRRNNGYASAYQSANTDYHSQQSHLQSASMSGEDKVAEKARHISNAEKPGFYDASNRAIPRNAIGRGKYANLIPEQKPPQTPIEIVRWFFTNEICILIMYTVLSLITRMWRIGKNNAVVWDEAHFGKFGSHYLKHEFYFDVHPPLGKMLVGLAGLLSGYGGQFEFKSGETYPTDVNYVGMRVIMALFGVAMVPLAWSSSGALGWNWRTRHALTIMVLFDNAWLVISRFILLDSMLLCFTFMTVHGLLMFHRHRHDSFGEQWWFWLTFTGFSIGLVASVKWVGLFATALVGLYTIEDLWDKFGDLKMPVRRYTRHWCSRILCLIVLPMAVYMLSFKFHFMILSRSGPGDAQMSSLFQAHLRGNDFAQAPLEAAYGSKVTFKNMGYGGGLLHSHIQTYPVGSQQQQVTCYHYRDNNNEFIITPPWEDPPLPSVNDTDPPPPRMLKSGNVIRLVHEQTGRNLHSHNVPAPVTKENLEVSGYGSADVGDSNDYWVVEVVDDMTSGKKGKPGEAIHSLTTRMRLKHQNLGCYLRAANAILPQWGWKQVEVSCDKENNPKDEHTYWNIETHINPRLPMGNAKLYRSPFLRDFVHLNVAMMTSNNALIPDQDKEDILASKPYDWPWLYNGLRMNGWGDTTTKYYLIGNPVIWWGSSASLIIYCLTYLWYKGRMQRRIVDLSPQDWEQFTFAGKVAGLGWFLHYLPFLIMARVCYIHHYLPTLYFAVLMMAHLLDHFLWNNSTARYRSIKKGQRIPLGEEVKNLTFFLFCSLVIGVFWWFRETAWGIDGPVWSRWGIRWRKSWNIKD